MTRQLFQYHATIGYHFIPGLKARVEHEGGDSFTAGVSNNLFGNHN